MGRETCNYATALPVAGFLDSRTDILSQYKGYPPILGNPEDYQIQDGDVFVCAVGEPEQKMNFVRCVEERGGEFASVVHPTAWIGHNVSVGRGCIIAPGAIVTADAVIGDHVIINVGASVSHDCEVRTGSTISPGCHIAGWCTLGENSFLGIHSALIPHVEIGAGAYVAAGAVVTRSCASGVRLMGVPAKVK